MDYENSFRNFSDLEGSAGVGKELNEISAFNTPIVSTVGSSEPKMGSVFDIPGTFQMADNVERW
jgi:hypothetical protein